MEADDDGAIIFKEAADDTMDTIDNIDNGGEGDDDEAAEAPAPKRIKSKYDAERERKEAALSEILLLMDDFAPIIPDAITDYHLARAGFQCEDTRVKRLLALATQKFISDITTDAIQYSKLRQQAALARDRKASSKLDKRTVLTMDDLASAMAEHGVNVKKPEYFM